jgi:hypothetical protein
VLQDAVAVPAVLEVLQHGGAECGVDGRQASSFGCRSAITWTAPSIPYQNTFRSPCFPGSRRVHYMMGNRPHCLASAEPNLAVPENAEPL